jgi:hypothetical protein
METVLAYKSVPIFTLDALALAYNKSCSLTQSDPRAMRSHTANQHTGGGGSSGGGQEQEQPGAAAEGGDDGAADGAPAADVLSLAKKEQPVL